MCIVCYSRMGFLSSPIFLEYWVTHTWTVPSGLAGCSEPCLLAMLMPLIHLGDYPAGMPSRSFVRLVGANQAWPCVCIHTLGISTPPIFSAPTTPPFSYPSSTTLALCERRAASATASIRRHPLWSKHRVPSPLSQRSSQASPLTLPSSL